MSVKKCNYQRLATTWQELEVGCPLDHCACGTHDAHNEEHECVEEPEFDEDVAAAERAAGWDPNP